MVMRQDQLEDKWRQARIDAASRGADRLTRGRKAPPRPPSAPRLKPRIIREGAFIPSGWLRRLLCPSQEFQMECTAPVVKPWWAHLRRDEFAICSVLTDGPPADWYQREPLPGQIRQPQAKEPG